MLGTLTRILAHVTSATAPLALASPADSASIAPSNSQASTHILQNCKNFTENLMNQSLDAYHYLLIDDWLNDNDNPAASNA